MYKYGILCYYIGKPGVCLIRIHQNSKIRPSEWHHIQTRPLCLLHNKTQRLHSHFLKIKNLFSYLSLFFDILPLKSMTSGMFVSSYVLSTRMAVLTGATDVEMAEVVV